MKDEKIIFISTHDAAENVDDDDWKHYKQMAMNLFILARNVSWDFEQDNFQMDSFIRNQRYPNVPKGKGTSATDPRTTLSLQDR